MFKLDLCGTYVEGELLLQLPLQGLTDTNSFSCTHTEYLPNSWLERLAGQTGAVRRGSFLCHLASFFISTLQLFWPRWTENLSKCLLFCVCVKEVGEEGRKRREVLSNRGGKEGLIFYRRDVSLIRLVCFILCFFKLPLCEANVGSKHREQPWCGCETITRGQQRIYGIHFDTFRMIKAPQSNESDWCNNTLNKKIKKYLRTPDSLNQIFYLSSLQMTTI